VKIPGRGAGGYGAIARSGPRWLDAARATAPLQCARSPSTEIFMHSIIAGGILAAALITACADPVGPPQQVVDDTTVVAAFARQRPTAPVSVPDSIGIPPSIPPIFEEVPAELDGSQ
jgi:hypothetical protein